jgi:hypothetical protein
MSFTLFTFALSGTLLFLFLVVLYFENRRSERSSFSRFIAKASPFLEMFWDKLEEGVEDFGVMLYRVFRHVVTWLLTHGVQLFFKKITQGISYGVRVARSRGVIKKRGASSIFLKQISEHKRQNSGGRIEEN